MNARLFSNKFTVRFLNMPDVKQLQLPASIAIQVLAAVGDQHEMSDVEKVRDFFNKVPQTDKEFQVWKYTTQAGGEKSECYDFITCHSKKGKLLHRTDFSTLNKFEFFYSPCITT